MKTLLALLLFLPLTLLAPTTPRGAQTFPKLGTTKKRVSTTESIQQLIQALPPALAQSILDSQTNVVIQSISKAPGNTFIVRWSGGPSNAVYQLLSKTNVSQVTWQSVGPPTTNSAATNPIVGKVAFLKVRATNQPVITTPGQLQWSKSLPAVVVASHCRVTGLTSDQAGNFIACGWFEGTVNLGTTNMTSTFGNAVRDGFIVKYGQQGTILWVKRFGNDGDDAAFAVTTDRQDNIIVTGAFSKTVDFGNGPLTTTGNLDIFVAKYTPAGVLIWVKAFGGTSVDQGLALATDTNGNVFLGASFNGMANFGGPILSRNSDSIAVVKLSSGGATTWARAWGGNTIDTVQGIAADKNGDVVITGKFYGNTNLGDGPKTGAGIFDAFLAKYSGVDGAHIWSKIFGSTDIDAGFGVTTDPVSGNVITTGGFIGTVNFGGGPVSTDANGGIYLLGFSPTGTWLWNKATGGNGDYGAAVTTDGLKIALTGTGSGLNFGGPNDPWVFGTGYFVTILNTVGNGLPVYQWIKHSGTSGDSVGNGVALNSSSMTAAGSWTRSIDLGGTTLSSMFTGAENGFVGSYAK